MAGAGATPSRPAGGKKQILPSMPAKKLLGIRFYSRAAAIQVQKRAKGSNKKVKLPTNGRDGTDRVSLWREICDLLEKEAIPGVVRDLLLGFWPS